MRTAYDSATPAAIPAAAKMVLWYIDGAYAWPAAELARFPDAVKVSITVQGHPAADVADVENGDLTPASAAGWIRSRTGHRSAIYCSLDTAPKIREACAGLTYDLWVADWTGAPHEIGGAVAVQYADPAHGSGGDFDLTCVTDENWYPAALTWEETALARAAQVGNGVNVLAHQVAGLYDLLKAHQ